MALIGTAHEVDPISRIEGHLGVKVDVDGSGNIKEANSHANLWRGFENFLIGRDPNDAITFTQRICGVCPLPHATASMFAVESVLGVSDGYITWEATGGKGVPAKAVLIRNIVYACEFLMSHITHFYHLAAPSYVQGPAIPPWTPYFATAAYDSNLRSNGRALPDEDTAPLVDNADGSASPLNLWSAVIKQYVKALRIRRLTFEAGAMFAGRMPMVSSFVAGGVTNAANDAKWTEKIAGFKEAMVEVATFVVREYIPLAAALGFLYQPYDNAANGGSGYGAGCKSLLAWGAFPDTGTAAGTALALKGGYYIDAAANGGSSESYMFLETKADTAGVAGKGVEFVKTNLVEFIARSRYSDPLAEFDDASGYAYPGDVSRTVPNRTPGASYFADLENGSADKYSWMKAPRIKSVADGNFYPMEVGPFSRMNVNGSYFATATSDKGLFVKDDLTLTSYGSVYGKVTTDNRGVDIGGGNYAGLDPAVIHEDLANALVRDGLAAVSGDGAIVDPTTTPGLIAWIITITCGFSTMDRLRARAIESFWLCMWILGSGAGAGGLGYNKTTKAWVPSSGTGVGDGWINQLSTLNASAGYTPYSVPTGTVSGMGVSEAPRGALAHFVTASNGKITKYQCVVPTTWNGSPKDGATDVTNAASKRGPIEAALIDVPFSGATSTTGNARGVAGSEYAPSNNATGVGGVEVLRVAQSFDPCIACAVH